MCESMFSAWVIGNVRLYSILQSMLPVDFVTKRVGEDYSLISCIIIFLVHYVTL